MRWAIRATRTADPQAIDAALAETADRPVVHGCPATLRATRPGLRTLPFDR